MGLPFDCWARQRLTSPRPAANWWSAVIRTVFDIAGPIAHLTIEPSADDAARRLRSLA
jgi:hypothetical protein